MRITTQLSTTRAEPTVRLSAVLRSILSHRIVQLAAILWLAAYLLIVLLARGRLPFDRPAVNRLPVARQLAAPTIGLIEVFVLMTMVFRLTRTRAVPEIAARAPARIVARREIVILLGLHGPRADRGWLVGPALGYRPFSFHLTGSIRGCAVTPPRGEVVVWALYNLAGLRGRTLPDIRRRSSNIALNLRSTNRAKYAWLMLVVLNVEKAFELAVFDNNILRFNTRQALLAGLLTLAVYFVGTVLPTMVLIMRLCCRAY